MREVVLDTETTGLDPGKGDRVVEIGAVEIIDKVASGRTFHVLVNPERNVPEEAFRVHGHSTQSLKDKPTFGAIVDDFLAFIREDPLVIHNAEFDTRFLNAELANLGRTTLATERIVDTLALARRKHPGAANSLDALCDRYRIDRSRRIKHGALLDAEILVDVYCELTGGRQRSLSLASNILTPITVKTIIPTSRATPLPERLNDTSLEIHRIYVEKMGGDYLWRKYPICIS
jgi:DNA polymerase III subunit epsilon